MGFCDWLWTMWRGAETQIDDTDDGDVWDEILFCFFLFSCFIPDVPFSSVPLHLPVVPCPPRPVGCSVVQHQSFWCIVPCSWDDQIVSPFRPLPRPNPTSPSAGPTQCPTSPAPCRRHFSPQLTVLERR